jgi:hypothetical protein
VGPLMVGLFIAETTVLRIQMRPLLSLFEANSAGFEFYWTTNGPDEPASCSNCMWLRWRPSSFATTRPSVRSRLAPPSFHLQTLRKPILSHSVPKPNP